MAWQPQSSGARMLCSHQQYDVAQLLFWGIGIIIPNRSKFPLISRGTIYFHVFQKDEPISSAKATIIQTLNHQFFQGVNSLMDFTRHPFLHSEKGPVDKSRLFF